MDGPVTVDQITVARKAIKASANALYAAASALAEDEHRDWSAERDELFILRDMCAALIQRVAH